MPERQRRQRQVSECGLYTRLADRVFVYSRRVVKDRRVAQPIEVFLSVGGIEDGQCRLRVRLVRVIVYRPPLNDPRKAKTMVAVKVRDAHRGGLGDRHLREGAAPLSAFARVEQNELTVPAHCIAVMRSVARR